MLACLIESAFFALGCAVEWHPGFRIEVGELLRHPGYRGREYVDLGARMAVDGVLTPRIVGEAAHTGHHDPQAIKKVWHCLARFGAPEEGAADSATPAPTEVAALAPGAAACTAGR